MVSVERFGTDTYIRIHRLFVCWCRDGYKPLFSERHGYRRGPHILRLGPLGDVTWRLLGRAVAS